MEALIDVPEKKISAYLWTGGNKLETSIYFSIKLYNGIEISFFFFISFLEFSLEDEEKLQCV